MNKVKLNSILSIIFLIFFFCSSSHSSATEITSIDTDSPEILTIERAIELVKATDPELSIARLNAENDELYMRLENMAYRLIDTDSIDTVALAEQKYIPKAQKDLSARVSKLYKETVPVTLRAKAIISYYDLLDAYNEKEWKKQRYQRVDGLAVLAKEKARGLKNTGTTQEDTMLVETRLASAQVEWLEAERKWEEAKIKQNEILGVDAKKDWLFSPEQDAVTENPPITFEDAVASLTADSSTRVQKKGDVQIAQLRVDLISKYSALSTDPGKIARNNLEKANIELEKMNRANVYALHSIYQSYEDGYKLLQTSKRAVELAKENYTKMITQFKQGLLDTVKVLQAEQELAHLEKEYVEAEHSFNQIRLNFQ
ncbi:TolC family protein [uncultured Brevibacillus sp.]|uniref:TolC family protein n=1 Tax=uncultured Brevibacillus sp. TaxID=169970 RepID=UPI0025944323|nr:TolC family protein [uncultured Brevibacillus sp.]